jgi:tetratricopeptide (TPR) repeat protein
MKTNTYDYISLNNRAVSLLLAGDNQQAVALLSKAFSSVRRELASARSSHKNFTLQSSIEFLQHDSFELPFLQDQQFYIYNHAIALSAEQSPSVIGVEQAPAFSSVIMFNLALTYHRVALTTRNKLCSDKAVSLYQLVLRLLKSFDFLGTVGVVKLASINNLAQLRYDQGQFDLAEQGMTHLPAGLRRVAEIGKHGLADTQLYGFLSSLFLLKAPKIAPAA